MRRKQKEDAEETATKKSRVISYLDEDDDGKEVEQDVDKDERKRKERLVILTLVRLFHLNLTDLVACILLCLAVCLLYQSQWLYTVRQVLSSTAHNSGIVSLNPTWGMNACLYFSCVFVLLCSLLPYPESSARYVQTCFSNSESGRAWAALAFSAIEMDTIGKM